jgi:hypothetical protein
MLKNNDKPGIASIPTVIVLLALILSAGALIASISISDNLSVSESNNSDKALNYAQLGAKDALEKVARNKDYATSSSLLNIVSGGCTSPYRGCASTSVAIKTSTTTQIISWGLLGDSIRKIQVDVNLDPNGNGLISSHAWQEF